MKEVLSTDSQTGNVMVKRFALTQDGVSVSKFRKVNTVSTEEVDAEISEIASKKDYSVDCAEIVSEQNNWLNVSFPVYTRIAINHPTIQILNKFSESAKILIMADMDVVKTFDIGKLDVGIANLDFLENDEILTETNPEDSEDVTRYFKSNNLQAIKIGDWESPIILNPNSVDNPRTVTISLFGNTDPAACGIFKVAVEALDE